MRGGAYKQSIPHPQQFVTAAATPVLTPIAAVVVDAVPVTITATADVATSKTLLLMSGAALVVAGASVLIYGFLHKRQQERKARKLYNSKTQ